MFDFTNVKIENIVVHHVGNKSREEALIFSQEPLNVRAEILNQLLLNYFLTPFKNAVFYNFAHESDLSLNEMNVYTAKIFENPRDFYAQSVNIAKHLYENSNHPKIQAGEFYVVHFSGCVVGDDVFDALGVFKSENKENYLKVQQNAQNFDIQYDSGVNIHKLDKGSLIFNTEAENGYKIVIVDAINKSSEAQYWKDEFLKLKPQEDEYFHTKNSLALCKKFVEEVCTEQNNVDRTQQIAVKNKAIQYFAEKDSFSMGEFEQEVLTSAEGIDAFRQYKSDYEQENDVKIADEFEISDQAVKGAKRQFKSIIKLDKNFHIYVHGNQELMERGFDPQTNMNFYTLKFKEEK